MPLRDHFHPPMTHRFGWDTAHGMRAAKIAERLNGFLPPKYRAGPTIHLGGFEVDVGTFDERGQSEWNPSQAAGRTMTLEVDPLDADEYEVKVFREYDLVAAIELLSPSNKDCPETRDIFTAKCAALLKGGVCVTLVDIVTSYRANLFGGLLDELGWPGPSAVDGIYVATLRGHRVNGRHRVNTRSPSK